MDYGNLFSRAWDILWKNKFLILLGILVVLGGSSSSGGNQSGALFQSDDFNNWQDMPRFEFAEPFQNVDLSFIAIGGIFLLVLILLVVGLSFWALGTISRGGLIDAVNDLDVGKTTNFQQAFRAGWQKGWKLIGIGLIPAIPGLILLVASVVTLVFYSGVEVFTRGNPSWIGAGTFLPLIVLGCLLIPVMLILSLLRTFANRACMLEDLGVIASYRRGFEVLGNNLGPVVILFFLQVAISIGIGIMMLIPGLLIALCCLLWPLFLLVEGSFKAFYSTLWTLAWNEWVGKDLVASEV